MEGNLEAQVLRSTSRWTATTGRRWYAAAAPLEPDER
jgi:hypothetical protein